MILEHLFDGAARQLDQALRTVFAETKVSNRPYPATVEEGTALSGADRDHAAGLMRINHTGEVCAQALYFGQAAAARDPAIAEKMHQASDEETEHLYWCEKRLGELDARASVLNPLWYAGSFALGAIAGAMGDKWSLGFVVETERQVEAHLEEHMKTLPKDDQRSRQIVAQMKMDEAAHAQMAEAAGGAKLPAPVTRAMAMTADLMKALSYRL